MTQIFLNWKIRWRRRRRRLCNNCTYSFERRFFVLIMTKLFHLRFSSKKLFPDFEHTLIAMRLTKFHFNCNDPDNFITIPWVEYANHVRGSYDLDKICFADSDMIYSHRNIDFMVFRWLFRCIWCANNDEKNAFSGYQMFLSKLYRKKLRCLWKWKKGIDLHVFIFCSINTPYNKHKCERDIELLNGEVVIGISNFHVHVS